MVRFGAMVALVRGIESYGLGGSFVVLAMVDSFFCGYFFVFEFGDVVVVLVGLMPVLFYVFKLN